MTVRRHALRAAPWASLAPLRPPQKARRGRPHRDHRRILNGIVWKSRTGAPWRDLPERYGPWQTVYRRFRRWQLAGIWDRLFAAVQRQEDAAGHLDWTLHFVDGSVIRAHQHAAGAKGGPLASPGPGRGGPRLQPGRLFDQGPSARGGPGPADAPRPHAGRAARGYRVPPVARPRCRPASWPRAGPGRPRGRPDRVSGDQGYRSDAIRVTARRRGRGSTIPRKANEARTGPFDRAGYRRRRTVEHRFNRGKQDRSLATRYEKRGQRFRAMGLIVSTLLWL